MFGFTLDDRRIPRQWLEQKKEKEQCEAEEGDGARGEKKKSVKINQSLLEREKGGLIVSWQNNNIQGNRRKEQKPRAGDGRGRERGKQIMMIILFGGGITTGRYN